MRSARVGRASFDFGCFMGCLQCVIRGAIAQFGHQLANDPLRTEKPSPVQLEVFGATKTAVREVVDESAENLHAIGPVAARIQEVHVPVEVAVLAGCQHFVRVTQNCLEEGAVLQLYGVHFFEGPAILDRCYERDGSQVQRLDLGSECHLVFSMMSDCPGSPMLAKHRDPGSENNLVAKRPARVAEFLSFC